PRAQASVGRNRGSPLGKNYTLGLAGRQIRLGPVAFWTCVGTLVIMASWSAVTATYFAFHDDVLAHLIARQAAMQFAYEDRIAEMRAQVDRVTSRQLLDQEQFERRLDQIAKRQSALESRASSLGALTDSAGTGATKPAPRSIAPREPAAGQPKPSPIGSNISLPPPPDSRRADSFGSDITGSIAAIGGAEAAIARLQNSLDRIEAGQTVSLNRIEESYDSKLKR